MKQKEIFDLYVEATFYYSRINNLSILEATNIFEDNFVFEELSRNYELLKTSDMHEALEIAEEIIKNKNNTMKLYHGSSALFDEIDLSKSQKYSDFGNGFYCTVIKKQAEDWAKRKAKRNNETPIIYEYDLMLNKNLKIKKFNETNEEWFDFVFNHRQRGNEQHKFDIVIGPIADDDVRQTIRMFDRGWYTKEQAIDKLKYKKISNQVSFHTQNAIEYLRFIKRGEIDG